MQEKNIFFVIPARRDSKGLPFKNRKLLNYTINDIPEEWHHKTIVTTNDEEIIKTLSSTKIKILERSERLSKDDVNIRDVMKDVIKKYEMKSDDTIVMLYLTSPGRKFLDVKQILDYYIENQIETLTCCVEPKTHPYLCLYEKENSKGEQVIKHDLYRRQDYPKCFELRHFVCIFKVEIIDKLNQNMYNSDTIFYKIDNDIDIDFDYELEEFTNQNKNMV